MSLQGAGGRDPQYFTPFYRKPNEDQCYFYTTLGKQAERTPGRDSNSSEKKDLGAGEGAGDEGQGVTSETTRGRNAMQRKEGEGEKLKVLQNAVHLGAPQPHGSAQGKGTAVFGQGGPETTDGQGKKSQVRRAWETRTSRKNLG